MCLDHVVFEGPSSYERDWVEAVWVKAREKVVLEGEPKDGEGNEFVNVCLPVLLFIYTFSPFI